DTDLPTDSEEWQNTTPIPTCLEILMSFSSLTCVLPLRLRNPCVCSVGGFLFVIGGDEVKEGDEDEKRPVTVATSNQVWRYDPRFSCWEQVESMLDRRAQFTCCVVEDVIYALGGRHTRPDTNTHASVASVEFYDMATAAWRKGPPMPQTLYGHASAVLDNSIYVSGGVPGNYSYTQDESRESSREVFFWDLKGRVWEKRASMSIARFSHRLATAHGYIYALLGMYEPFCDIERYHPRSDHWMRLKPLLTGSFNYGMVSMSSGNLLVFGGRRWSNGQEVVAKSVLEKGSPNIPKSVTRVSRAKLCDKWDFWEQAEEVNRFSVKKVTLKQMSFQDEAKLQDEIEK
uniref:Uncharacterized protein n=1 Tax=Neolamprologus brichardi TaxID=32507 RepID=A0A3Q4G5S4_NEOBR